MAYKKGDKLKIYYATNRNVIERKGIPDFGDRFHQDGPHFYRVGSVIKR